MIRGSRPLALPFAALALCFVLCLPSAASPWTLEDLLHAENVQEWDVSPDGRRVTWVLSTVEQGDKGAKRISNLWLEPSAGAESFALTRGSGTVGAPQFSPDGRLIAFLSDRDVPGKKDSKDLGKRQLWLIRADGGEAYPATRLDRDVEAFAWADTATLVVLAAESASAWERERKEAKDTSVVVDDLEHTPPTRLFRVNLEGDVVRLTTNRDWIGSFTLSPDGRQALVIAEQDLKYQFDQKVLPHVRLVDIGNGTSRRILEGTRLLPSEVAWAADSSAFYFLNDFSRHPLYRTAAIREVHLYDLAADRAQKVEIDWPRGAASGLVSTPDGFLVLLEDGVRQRPARYVRKGGGWSRQDLAGGRSPGIGSWKLARDAKSLVFRHSRATEPVQLFAASLEGANLGGERQLTKLNPGYGDKAKGKVEVLHWTGALGETVEGLLHYPLDWREGDGPRPLVVEIHGGPTSADQDAWSQRWAAPNILHRQRGAFVLQVNYHGSTGYGLDWVESIEGRYYELERVDILAGVDFVIARGLVDPDRLGCVGWSNGGILTADLIVATRRFKVASVGAADVEWLSDWANVDFGAAFDNYYFGGTPWEKTQEYIARSPFFRLAEVTTPTIVFTGTEDRNVPPHQSWSLFRALQYLEKAPARLVLFPGEPHGLQKLAHQRRKVEEELGWFDRYLYQAAPGRDAAIKTGSPLAALLARAKAARAGEALGLVAGETLVPETVLFEGLEVGRFEVTGAQLAALDPAAPPAAGNENLPASGVSFAQASRYVAALAQATGRPFRLPTEEEAKKLAKAGGDGGNTLDRWAGYSPNPEDAERIHRALAALPQPSTLLLPVGSLPGKVPAHLQDAATTSGGDLAAATVFDLDGNVAEWAVGKNGQGVAVGPSADRPTKDRAKAGAPGPGYVGLRVVVGEPR